MSTISGKLTNRWGLYRERRSAATRTWTVRHAGNATVVVRNNTIRVALAARLYLR